MSSLNLQPNVAVLAVQTGIFLTNLFVVKKLLLTPYLKVQEQRRRLTVGNKEDAQKLVQQNEGALQNISKKIHGASEEARSLRDEVIDAANKEKAGIFANVEQETKSFIAGTQREIEAELTREKQKIPQIVNDLTAVLYQQTLD